MGRPARAGALPGPGAVGTPRNGRGTETMETLMTRKIRRATQAKTPDTAKAKTAAPRARQGSQTKTQIALALLERSRGASLAEMQRARDWQAHSVRGFLAGTVRKMPGITLLSEKPESGARRYRIEAAGK